MTKFLNKLQYLLYKRLKSKFEGNIMDIVQDSEFFTSETEDKIKMYKKQISDMPEDLLYTHIDLVSLVKYITYMEAISRYDKERSVKGELKGVIKALDRIIDMYKSFLPNRDNEVDEHTGIDTKDLMNVLQADYTKRMKENEQILIELTSTKKDIEE